MQLEDKDFFEINKKLIDLREAKFDLSKEAKKEIPLNQKQAFILFCFTLVFFSGFSYLSSLVLSQKSLGLDTYANYRASCGLLLGSCLSASALLSLVIYPFFANHDVFQKKFNCFHSSIKTTLVCFFSVCVFGVLIGVLYFVSVGFLLLTLKDNFGFNTQEINNWFLCVSALSFVLFYFKNHELPFVKNKSKQQEYINEREKNLLPEIKRIEDEEAALRQKIIDSVTHIDELAYFKHFLRNSKVVEVARYQETIEEKVLKNTPYDSVEDYEKDILIERLNNEKKRIVNN